MRKLNLGSGDIKIEGVESHDINKDFNCEHSFDLKLGPWPLETDSYNEVYLFHCIEHIEKKHHKFILSEIHRILVPGGLFICSYPEFEIILQNWLENAGGQKGFWEANIYGLQRSPSDYHVAAMDSMEFKDLLFLIGFKDVRVAAEIANHHNTVVHCLKGEPMKSYENVVFEDVIR